MGKGKNSTSTPGMDVLLITTAYTVLCIIIGFLFKCRKRKWRNDNENTSAKPGNEEKDDQNTPEAWMDTNPCMRAVRDKMYHTSDTNSVESDDSSKAYEYWEHVFGPDGKRNAAGDSNTYELFTTDLETIKIPQSVNVYEQLKGREKKVSMTRRFLFGRRKRRFNVKKMETKSMGNKSVQEVVDRSGEGDDTYEMEMKEIYKLAVP